MEATEIATLTDFFNHHHDKLLGTANALGEPGIALMGTPKLLESGDIGFEISDAVSMAFDNIRQKKVVVFDKQRIDIPLSLPSILNFA